MFITPFFSNLEGSFSLFLAFVGLLVILVQRINGSGVMAVAAGRDTDLQRFHWNSWVMPKVNYLIWRAILGGVDTKDALVRRGVNLGNTLCCRCGLENEDAKHVFVGCLAARSVWWQISMVNPPFDGDLVAERVDYFNNQPGVKNWKKVSLRGLHPSLSLDGLNLKRQVEDFMGSLSRYNQHAEEDFRIS
ncbi:putative reverse transcriptase zinc-binding domain-containing protein [Helianthus annuus]|nr:putative reverse transcriptase zinc-binding domain-containing protein [Helianthus annuus]